jgi:hypothetical protein
VTHVEGRHQQRIAIWKPDGIPRIARMSESREGDSGRLQNQMLVSQSNKGGTDEPHAICANPET